MEEDDLPDQIKHPYRLFNNSQWQQCYIDWLKTVYRPRRKKSTVARYAWLMRNFFADADKTPEKYTRHDVEMFVDSLTDGPGNHGKQPAASTRNNRLGILRSFYLYASNYGVEVAGNQVPLLFASKKRGMNPTANIPRSEGETERRAFEHEEVLAFFSVIPRDTIHGKRDYALFLFYFLTGRRLSEVTGLTWGDIRQHAKFEDGSVGIAYTWQGKGRTAKEHWVQLDPLLWTAILDYLEFAGRLDRMHPGAAIFVSQKSQWAQKPMTQSRVDVLFDQYASDAGLRARHGQADLTLHSFRSTYGIESYEANGHDIIKVAEELDHKNIQTTRYYLGKRRRARASTASASIRAKYGRL